MNKTSKLIIKYVCLAAGIYIMTLGGTLAMTGAIGVCPLDAAVITGANITGISIGSFNIIVNLVFFFAQIIILKKEYQPLQLLQFPISFLFGWFVDFNLKFIWAAAASDSYIVSILFVIIGMAVEAIGINLVLQADVVMTPVDGFYYVLSQKLGKSIGTMRLALDGVLLVLNTAAILTVSHVWTIREGTLISFFVLGPCIDLFRRPVAGLMSKLDNDLKK